MGDIFGNSPTRHSIRDTFEKKAQERKKNLLHLIRSYLLENGLAKTSEQLIKEAKLGHEIEVCDNIDLDTILQEYSSFYFAKFNKHPKITKKIDVVPLKVPPKRNATTPKLIVPKEVEEKEEKDEFEIRIKQISNVKVLEKDSDMMAMEEFEPSSQDKELVDHIKREIMKKNLGIHWGDCIGMKEIIQLLQEAVVYPIKYPRIFSNITSWKSILLYGPPGTGKTLIAKALATESSTTFINFSPSTFISKWRGESEKLVRLLFEMAFHYAPTTIFIDELDALASKRDELQHEASRRFKSELLSQMDGLQHQHHNVFILATTNIPWSIDSAVLRRFDKRIYIDLPTPQNRSDLFKKHLNLNLLQDTDYDVFKLQSEGFSCSDIKLACKNAQMIALRRYIAMKKDVDSVEVVKDDVVTAIRNTKPVQIDRQKYVDWEKSFGCV